MRIFSLTPKHIYVLMIMVVFCHFLFRLENRPTGTCLIFIYGINDTRQEKKWRNFVENTFKSFIFGVPRAFKKDWECQLDFSKGPLFGDVKKGICRAVNVNCRARKIQTNRNHSVSHNIF